jgi:serine/threonine protein kinase
MVLHPTQTFANVAVLFSSREQCWKLADFGSASLATSKKLVTTTLGRGTEGYRAPEVLRTRGHYNKRSDSFALGCITYEIVTGRKLFDSDWAVQEYSREGVPVYPTKWPPCKPGTRLLQLGEFTSRQLAVEPMSRLNARSAARHLQVIRGGEQESDPITEEDDDYDCSLGHDTNTTALAYNPVVQPSLRVDGVGKKEVKPVMPPTGPVPSKQSAPASSSPALNQTPAVSASAPASEPANAIQKPTLLNYAQVCPHLLPSCSNMCHFRLSERR